MPLGEVLAPNVADTFKIEWQNFVAVFEAVPLALHGWNSFLIVVIGVPVTLLVSSLAGFAITVQPMPLRRWLITFAIVTMLIPPSAVWLWRYQLFEQLGARLECLAAVDA